VELKLDLSLGDLNERELLGKKKNENSGGREENANQALARTTEKRGLAMPGRRNGGGI